MKKIFFFFVICVLNVFPSCSRSIDVSTSIDIPTSDIDNRYNNVKANLSSKLAQIGNKLYYRYDNRFGISGVYEITEGQVKKLKDDICLNFVFHEKFLNVNTNPISYYEDEEDKSDTAYVCEISADSHPNYFEVTHDNLYYCTDVEIYCYDGTAFKVLASAKDFGIQTISSGETYILNNEIYFLNCEERNGTVNSKVYRYHTLSKKLDSIDLGACMPDNMVAQGDTVYYLDDLSLYRVDFLSKAITKVTPFTQDNVIDCFNVCDDCICVGNADGVFLSNNQKDFRKISDDKAYDIYFLDSRFIYYITDDGVLMRVTREGTVKEKVFSGF